MMDLGRTFLSSRSPSQAHWKHPESKPAISIRVTPGCAKLPHQEVLFHTSVFSSFVCGLVCFRPRPGRRSIRRPATEVAEGFKKDGFTNSDLEAELDTLVKDLCDAPPIRICIIGKRGVGKSTLVNSLRSLKPADSGAATVGADETTTEETTYNFCGMHLQDLPGCEGSIETAMMGEEYIHKYRLHRADACIFVYTTVLEERMLECARMLQCDHQVPTFLVRNKVGTACRNEVDDGNAASTSEAFQHIRETAMNQITKEGSKYEMFAQEARLFFVEAKYRDAVAQEAVEPYQQEFLRLKDAVQMQIRDEGKRKQAHAIMSRNAKELARLRAEACLDIVGGHCLAGVFASEIPFLIYRQRRQVVKAFMKQFGLPEAYVRRKGHGFMKSALGTQSAWKEFADQVILNVAVHDVAQGGIMYLFCRRAVRSLEPIAEEYYRTQMVKFEPK